MKKLLILALISASLHAMDSNKPTAMDLRESAEFIRSLVEGELEVNDRQVSFPGSSRLYTLQECKQAMKPHGVSFDTDKMVVENPDLYADNLSKFFTNQDIEVLEIVAQKISPESLVELSEQEEKMNNLMNQLAPSVLKKAQKTKRQPREVFNDHLDRVFIKRAQLFQALIEQDPIALKDALQGPLHIADFDPK